MTRIKSLILTLEDPVKLFLAQEALPDKSLLVDDVKTTRPGFPPWAVCADILVNSQSRIFVGVTYPVHEDSKDLVRDLSSRISNKVVRYNNLSVEELMRPYKDDDYNIHRLEITWTDISADTVEAAQLDSGLWYFSNEPSNELQVLAFGLTDIDEVLDEYKLALPAVFPFTPFTPKFVG